MSEPIGALHASLSAGHAEFASDMKKARDAVQKNATGMQAAMATAKRGFDATAKSIKALSLAAAAATAVVGRMVLKQVDQAQQARKEAQSAGLTVEALTALRYAAELSGVSQQQLGTALVITAKNAELAAKGSGTAKDAYASLGISVTDATGKLKTSDMLMGEVAERFAKMEDGARKTALATQMFGRQGAALIPILNSGSAGIKEMTDEAAQLGLVLDTDTARAAERFDDNLTRLKGVKQGLVMAITRGVLPTLEQFTDKMVEAAQSTERMETASEKAATAIKLLASSGLILKSSLGAARGVISDFWVTVRATWRKLRGHEPWSEGFGPTWDPFEEAQSILDLWQKTIDEVNDNKPPGQLDLIDEETLHVMRQRGEEVIQLLEREIALIGDASRTGAARWDLMLGKDKALSEFHKGRILELAQELDTVKAVEKAREEGARHVERAISALQQEAGAFGMTAEQAKIYELSLKGATKEQLEQASALMRDIETKKQAKQVLEDLRTPMDAYIERMKLLNRLLKEGAISQEQHKAAAEKAQKALVDAVEAGNDKFQELARAIDGWGKDSAAAIADFARSGASDFKKMIDSMIDDLLRMMIYQNVTGPLFKNLSGLFSGVFSVAGPATGASAATTAASGKYMEKIMGGWLTGMHAKGAAFLKGEIVPFARGGVVSKPTVFPMAKGMGLMGEAGPEAVLPLTRTSSGNLGVEATGVSGGEGQTVNHYFVISSPDAEGFDRLCRRNAISIVRATNAALERNVGRKELKKLLD